VGVVSGKADPKHVVGFKRLLIIHERAFVERFGLGVAALGEIQRGEVVEVGADIRVVGTERLLGDGERALRQRLRLGIAALSAIPVARMLTAVPTFASSGPN
jgi:hypothetical protein